MPTFQRCWQGPWFGGHPWHRVLRMRGLHPTEAAASFRSGEREADLVQQQWPHLGGDHEHLDPHERWSLPCGLEGPGHAGAWCATVSATGLHRWSSEDGAAQEFRELPLARAAADAQHRAAAGGGRKETHHEGPAVQVPDHALQRCEGSDDCAAKGEEGPAVAHVFNRRGCQPKFPKLHGRSCHVHDEVEAMWVLDLFAGSTHERRRDVALAGHGAMF
mmetsp:Transcript_27526/g.44351  ORF Transcript_27526/g.44351 Transcript_27526/m.44351 type:complete len:218 (+) Transcript_27526:286-939(+)